MYANSYMFSGYTGTGKWKIFSPYTLIFLDVPTASRSNEIWSETWGLTWS